MIGPPPPPPPAPTIAINPIPSNIINVNNIINKADAETGVTISGTASDPVDSSVIIGQTVTLTLNGKTYISTVQPNGTWSINISPTDAKH